jgi:hypothetical protein
MKTRIAGVRILLFICVTLIPVSNFAAAKRVLFYGPTHQSGSVAETVVENSPGEFAPIGTGPTDSAIWTPGATSAASDWSRKTTADFLAFDAIVIGDGGFGESPVHHWAAAIANRSTWSSAVTGNVLLFGGDAENHADHPGAVSFIQAAVRFAAEGSDPGPGLFISFWQAHPMEPSPVDSSQKAISHLLSGLGSFTLGQSEFDTVRKLATHPLFDCISENQLSNWEDSSHSGFTSWTSGYLPLAMVTDAPPEFRTPFGSGTPGFPNGEKGLVHILAKRRASILPFPDHSR